jgi:hypothetical protein
MGAFSLAESTLLPQCTEVHYNSNDATTIGIQQHEATRETHHSKKTSVGISFASAWRSHNKAARKLFRLVYGFGFALNQYVAS